MCYSFAFCNANNVRENALNCLHANLSICFHPFSGIPVNPTLALLIVVHAQRPSSNFYLLSLGDQGVIVLEYAIAISVTDS